MSPSDAGGGPSPLGLGASSALARWADALEAADPQEVPDALVQRLLALAVRLYAAKLDLGQTPDPFPPGGVPTATAVGLAVARMLRAADVELFELVMWQQLIDRPKDSG